MRTRRGRARWFGAAVVVCVAAAGIAVAQRSGDTPNGVPASATRSSRFNVLPASLASRSQARVVQVDADRAVVFGGVTWDKKDLSVANDGVIIDFAKKSSTAIAGPNLDDGLVRASAAVSGARVLFFGMECASRPLREPFDGEGYVADPCVDAPLTLTTFDTTTGAWSDPVTAPPSVGGNVGWVDNVSVVGHTAVIHWLESRNNGERYTAYDIPGGRWRALDSSPEPLKDWCSTGTDVVGVTYADWNESDGGVPPRPRISLLDPKTGTWNSVDVPEVYGPAVGGLVCAANRPVVYGYPNFATVLFAYSPSDSTWQRLPAPDKVFTGRTLGVGDLVVSWTAPPKDDPNHTSLQTIDLAQSQPRWSSNPTAPVWESTEFATGVFGGGAVIARVGDRLSRIVVARST